MSAKEWTPYRCTIPAPDQPSFSTTDCDVLRKLFHVAHVREACRIIEDGIVRARLIGDESRLKKTRTSVTWLSANYWHHGSIYGTVQFTFAWDELLEGKNIYWVEAMTSYNPDAYRFLITERCLQSSKYIHQYDPSADKGPLRFRDGTWYWNDQYTSELMFDANIPLSLCKNITFIDHRKDRCRLYGMSCKERLQSPDVSGSRVLAFVLCNRPRRIRGCLRREKADGSFGPGHGVRESLETLFHELCNGSGFGGPIKSKPRAVAVVQGALALYGAGKPDEAAELMSVLASADLLKRVLVQLSADFLQLHDFALSD